jgi:hypothetical protein
MQVEIIEEITQEQFEKFDDKTSKTTFTKQGMVITVGGDLYLRSKDEKYYSVKKEQKPLGISFNRYWR